MILTARIALEVLLAAADIWRASKGVASSRATAENLMKLLQGGKVLFPDPGKSPSTGAAKATKRASRKSE